MAWTNQSKNYDNDFILLEDGNFEYLLLETGDRIMLETADYNHFEYKTQKSTAPTFANTSRTSATFTNVSRN